MTLYSAVFYLTAVFMIISTGLAVTRNNLVHAVLYLVLSFFGSAVLFFLLGAPLLAALEVIIYAGAIMILFLFIVMMLKVETSEERISTWIHMSAPVLVGAVYLLACIFLVYLSDPAASEPMSAARVHPRDFAEYLFTRHWLAIEMVSLLLLIALIGVLHLGLGRAQPKNTNKGGSP